MARETQPLDVELSRLHWGEWLDTDEKKVKVQSYTSLLLVKAKSSVVVLTLTSLVLDEEEVSILYV